MAEASAGQEGTVRPAAVVTGSSRGIGHAIACLLAEKGYAVCINYASPDRSVEAQMLAESIKDACEVDAIAVQADVSDFTEAKMLIDTAKEAFGRIDVLVNNAGITRDSLLVRMSEDDFDDVIAVNLKGAFNCCKAATPYMMKQRFGRIVNMGSVVGVGGNPGQANYAASKAGLIGLSKSLARELASRNITVNVIAPGFIDTDMTRILEGKHQEAILAKIACKRFGTAREVAGLACFLASGEAGYITGQVIGIDGGMTL